MGLPLKEQRVFFTKVKVARDLLRERADVLLQQYLNIVDMATAAGDYETAAKAMQWLMDHMPAEDDGTRIVDVSVDKKQQQVQPQALPQIQIGIAVGGVSKELSAKKVKALPAKDEPLAHAKDGEVIDEPK